jgi:thiol-disulfide isomerase/thioredoxin
MKQIAVFFLLSLLLHAQELDVLPEPPTVVLPPKEAAMEALFSIPETTEALETAVANATKLGVPQQSILEARFLFHVEHKNDPAIVALLPQWENAATTFSLDQSEIFAAKEDFLAVIEFIRALKALQENKRDDFKKHITEALWLSPAQASAFTPYIENLRLAEHIKSTTVPLDSEISELHAVEKKVSLKSILGENRGILLHFWSPWSPDCETSINDLETVAPALAKEKIQLASILIDGRTDILAEAKEFLQGQDTPLPGPQLLDRGKDSLVARLRVTDVPTLVLLSPDGKILFHGRPSDEQLLVKAKELPPLKEAP